MGRKQKEIEEFEFDAKELAKGLGLMRLAFGVFLFLFPRRSARGWTGERAEEGVSRLALRGMGARDIAMGTGLLIALDRGAPARGWLEASVLSDAGDAVATLFDGQALSGPRRVFWFVGEVGAALFGGWLATELDD
jgi:hypothetical protein